MENKTIDIVVPCYNEHECIELLCDKINRVFDDIEGYNYKIILVNDGSSDKTIECMKDVCKKDKRIKYISLARNFGKESAIYVGLSYTQNELVVLMDADLQHPPALIPQMLSAIESGYDRAAARRISRKGEGKFRSVLSTSFYRVFNKVTSLELKSGQTDYCMMTRKVVDAIVSMKERERFTKGIYSWIGFDTKWIEYENVERVAGKTKWSIRGLFSYAGNGFIAFATTPLRIATYLGLIITIGAFIYGIFVLIGALKYPELRDGYSSLMLVILFLGGVIITILGIIGEYLARIYLEVKQRPLFIVKESNFDEEI